MIRNAAPADHAALLALWQANAPRQGYASRPDAEVDRLLFRHPYFSYEYTFVRAEQGRAVAFICGCVGNDIPHGRERGCFTCLAADPAWDTTETTVQVLDALEEAVEPFCFQMQEKEMQKMTQLLLELKREQEEKEVSKEDVLHEIKSVNDILKNPDVSYEEKGTLIRTIVDQIVYDKESGKMYFDIIVS